MNRMSIDKTIYTKFNKLLREVCEFYNLTHMIRDAGDTGVDITVGTVIKKSEFVFDFLFINHLPLCADRFKIAMEYDETVEFLKKNYEYLTPFYKVWMSETHVGKALTPKMLQDVNDAICTIRALKIVANYAGHISN